MRILVTGSSGLIGSATCSHFSGRGHEVLRLVRGPASGAAEGTVSWDPAEGRIDADGLDGLDVVIHLAGENIAEGRWDEAKKRRIRDSRVQGTRLLVDALASRHVKPKLLLSASAIGFYGSRAGERLREYSDPGRDFLARVCVEWEAEARRARDLGVRVVPLRFGMVLGRDGGALAKMLPPFRFGVGGRIGNGRHWWSWVALPDVPAVMEHVIDTPAITGPVNVVAPEPCMNRTFTKALGRVLLRPTILPLPAIAARLAFGEMASALLLASQRVLPERLEQTRFAWGHPELEPALRHLLGKA